MKDYRLFPKRCPDCMGELEKISTKQKTIYPALCKRCSAIWDKKENSEILIKQK